MTADLSLDKVIASQSIRAPIRTQPWLHRFNFACKLKFDFFVPAWALACNVERPDEALKVGRVQSDVRASSAVAPRSEIWQRKQAASLRWPGSNAPFCSAWHDRRFSPGSLRFYTLKTGRPTVHAWLNEEGCFFSGSGVCDAVSGRLISQSHDRNSPPKLRSWGDRRDLVLVHRVFHTAHLLGFTQDSLRLGKYPVLMPGVKGQIDQTSWRH